ncbi:hypothetical protein GCM10010275_72080 [Streptomyces litmocidini]|nr:hypothetical protein GCM10010275_72080 [Streptomyces litmocidini]
MGGTDGGDVFPVETPVPADDEDGSVQTDQGRGDPKDFAPVCGRAGGGRRRPGARRADGGGR